MVWVRVSTSNLGLGLGLVSGLGLGLELGLGLGLGSGSGLGSVVRVRARVRAGVRVSSVDQLRLCPRRDARLLHGSDRRVDRCPAEVGSLRGHLPADPRASRWQAGEPSRVVRVALGGPRNLGRRVGHGV